MSQIETNSLAPTDPLRQLQRRFLTGMAAIAALVTLNQVVLQPWLIQLTSDAPVINVAGRQRMLSQRLSKATLELFAAESLELDVARPREEVRVALAEWTQAHRGLQHGDESLKLPPNEHSRIQSAFAALEPHFQTMRAAATTLLSTELTAEELRREVDVILREEKQYLPQMDALVGMFESESRRRVASLRTAGWAILAAVLLLLGWLIRFSIRPVLRLIEERVAERTERLRDINRQLEREIVERKQAEQRTRELLDQLARASRLNSLGQMAAGLAHELNQPLGAIANYAEAARYHLDADGGASPDAEYLLQRIAAAGLRAGTIVHRLRSFIQHRPSVREAIRIESLIEEVIELCRPESRKRGARIVLEPPPEALPPLRADPIQIQQVLVNLIHNALQAMERTPAALREVRVAVGAGEDELTIEVRDRGCGFAPERAATLFDPFVTTRADGLGMGLAICRSIVQEHSGRLWADAPTEGGAVFSLTLPWEPRHELADCLHH